MKPEISVIVTVFNKENLIEKCLKSLKNQTFKKYEVLVINDGSTDQSEKIIQNVCNRDKRFNYFYQRNQGVSSARNLGIKKAKGDYLFFVDGDDFVDRNYLKQFYQNNNVDLVLSGYKHIKNNEILNYVNVPSIDGEVSRYKDIFFSFQGFTYIGLPYAKMFKKSIIEKNNIFFDKNIDFGEDTLFVFQYLNYCKTVKSIRVTSYNNVLLDKTLSRKFRSDIWQINCYLINALNTTLKFKFNDYWAFMYLRGIILSLNKTSLNKQIFFEVCNQIRNDEDFDHLQFKKIKTWKRKFIILLLKLDFKYVLYLRYFFKNK